MKTQGIVSITILISEKRNPFLLEITWPGFNEVMFNLFNLPHEKMNYRNEKKTLKTPQKPKKQQKKQTCVRRWLLRKDPHRTGQCSAGPTVQYNQSVHG